MTLHQMVVLLILLAYGLIALKKPIFIAKCLTYHIHLRGESGIADDRPARLIWSDEDRWRLLYPEQYQFFRLTGYVALSMMIAGILMWFVSGL